MDDRLLVGVDVGGTFTDCSVVDGEGVITTAKAPTTPDEFSRGVIDALTAMAATRGTTLDQLLARTERLVHGNTVGINALVTRDGADVGLISTVGHGEAILIMNGGGRTAGVPAEDVIDYARARLPEPFVPPGRIVEVQERIDSRGQVVLPLREEDARRAVTELLDQGVQAIAVSLLWSFLNPVHELLVKRIVQELAPEVFVSVSSEVAPRAREYPRTVATVMNAFIGPVMEGYVNRMETTIAGHGLRQGITYSGCAGGVLTRSMVTATPILSLQSGPAMGIVGSAYLGSLMGHRNIISTDMGGTTFDVGLVVDGAPVMREGSIIEQHELHLPMVDLESVGAGGGSIAWVDEVSGSLRVGPQSAGASPGPACYRRGGTQATVTDADVVLGVLNPGGLLGGRMPLDADAARDAVAAVAARTGLGLHEAAAGIRQVVDSRMADLIRRMTLFKGHDPRDFVIYSFGGAGPSHAGLYAQALGVEEVVIPLANAASVWSALGAACADITLHVDRGGELSSPFAAGTVSAALDAIRAEAAAQLGGHGVKPSDQRIETTAFMRLVGQVFELGVPIEVPVTERSLDDLVARFASAYEKRYGEGTAYLGAGVLITRLRATGIGATVKPRPRRVEVVASRPAPASRRPVYWSNDEGLVDTPIFVGEGLVPGAAIDGPAVIELAHTTIAVHPGQRAEVDAFGNVVLRLGSSNERH